MTFTNMIDHTILSQLATEQDFEKGAKEVETYKFFSLCVPSSQVRFLRGKFPHLNICTVIGFPHGNSSTKAKISETKQAVLDGVNEVDMVINLSDVKNGYFNNVLKEIKKIKKICGERVLKVIIESGALTDKEIKKLTAIVIKSGADFIKTSTGMYKNGASLSAVSIMSSVISKKNSNLKIKVSGGVNTKEKIESYLVIPHVKRIGTSSGVSIINDSLDESKY